MASAEFCELANKLASGRDPDEADRIVNELWEMAYRAGFQDAPADGEYE